MTKVFGQVYAALYDSFYAEKDYDGETEWLAQAFERHARQPVKRILDLGCGTGNHAVRLASRGYGVIGVDRSEEMLAVAARKARRQQLDLDFQQDDIASLNLQQTFDAVLMMFAVLSYQLEDADVLNALRTARRHLEAEGLLLFDVWYGPTVLAQGTQDRLRTVTKNETIWIRTSAGQLETKRNLCHVDFSLQQVQDNAVLSATTERHTMRYFFPEEIDWFLSEAGFRLLLLRAFPEFDHPPNDATWNVMVLATAA